MDNTSSNDDQPMQSVELDETYIDDKPPEEILSPDGLTTTIILEDEYTPSSKEWFDNLAEVFDDAVLDDLGRTYLDLIEIDVEDRKERDILQSDGLKKSGIGEPAPGGAVFEGASRVTHPVLTESYIDFSASTIKELFPPTGPVRTYITGKPDKKKMDKATRKSDFMNWQLTREIPSYRPELERLLTQLPVGGSQYMKLYHDANKGRPDVEFVPIDDMILPAHAKNFLDVSRKFHRMTLDENTFQNRVQSGQYRDLELVAGGTFTRTESAKATDKIEGKEDQYSDDASNTRVVYEGCIHTTISEDKDAPKDKLVPYLITIDDETGKVLSIYRNWNEKDEKCLEIEYLVDFTFIPWRGVFGLSLLQCLGGLPDALTGSLRALMDSALISNMQGGLKLKSQQSGASVSIDPTQVTEIDSMGQDDIRKVFMAVPFNPPSQMLFQLLGFLTSAAQGIIGTAEEKISDASNNMPVGTTLALIEQGAKVFSAIHARLQESQRRCLEILHRLNKDHLPDGKIAYGTDPKDYVTREDFEGQMDVRPVSDPNIFSESQRFAQVQFVMQSLTQAAPTVPQVVQLFDLRALYARAFELAKIPDYEDFLPETPKPQLMNPVDENLAMCLGKPVKAYAGQNHEAHIQVHLDFAQNPLFGKSPLLAQKFGPEALAHLQDHMLVWYDEMMKLAAGQQKEIDWDNDMESAVMMAKVTKQVDQAAQLAFGQIAPLITAAMQQLQAMAPKPPQDPMVAVTQQDNQNKFQLGQGKLSLQQQKQANDAQAKRDEMQTKAAAAERDYQLEMQRIGTEADTQIQTTTIQSNANVTAAHVNAAANLQDTAMNTAANKQNAEVQSQTTIAQTLHDNQTATNIAAMKIKADDATKLKDGGGLTKE